MIQIFFSTGIRSVVALELWIVGNELVVVARIGFDSRTCKCDTTPEARTLVPCLAAFVEWWWRGVCSLECSLVR